MRVTKNVENFITEQVNAKYDEAIKSVLTDYEKRKADAEKVVSDYINDVLSEANEKIVRYIRALGFNPDNSWGGSNYLSIRRHSICDSDEGKELRNKRKQLVEERDKTIKQLIIRLELGEMALKELNDALSTIEVGTDA